MSSSTLKIMAIITMLIDHIGAVFFPSVIIFRIIGRIAFPIFCYTLVEGYTKTKNVKHYILRLGIFALLSEVPFDLAFYKTSFAPHHQNIFFTLCLGVLALYLYEFIYATKGSKLAFLAVFCIGMIAQFFNADYGLYGIMILFFIYCAKGQPHLLKIFLTVTSLTLFLMVIITTRRFYIDDFVQSFQLLALPLMLCYNGKRGLSLKYFFYLFYPVHLLVIAIIHFSIA